MLQPGPGERQQRLGRRREAVADLVLVGPSGQQRARPQDPHGIGIAGHPAPEHARGLEHPLLVEARLAQLRRLLGGGEVVLAVDPLPRRRDRQPERAARGLQELDVDAGALGDLGLRVAILGAEQALDRHQREPLLGDGPAQVLQRHPVLVQLVQQLPPGLASTVVGQVLEQALGFPVHVRADAIAGEEDDADARHTSTRARSRVATRWTFGSSVRWKSVTSRAPWCSEGSSRARCSPCSCSTPTSRSAPTGWRRPCGARTRPPARRRRCRCTSPGCARRSTTRTSWPPPRPATASRSSRTSSTPIASRARSRRAAAHWPRAGRSERGRSCARRWRCGEDRRWPTWPSSRSRRPRSRASKSNG